MRARPLMAVLTAAGLALFGCAGGDATDGEATDEATSLDEWHAVYEDVVYRWNDVVNGGDGDDSMLEMCESARTEFRKSRDVLLSPPDDQLRDTVPDWVESVERYYDACVEGDVDERRAVVMKTVEAGEPVSRRLNQLGYSI